MRGIHPQDCQTDVGGGERDLEGSRCKLGGRPATTIIFNHSSLLAVVHQAADLWGKGRRDRGTYLDPDDKRYLEDKLGLLESDAARYGGF